MPQTHPFVKPLDATQKVGYNVTNSDIFNTLLTRLFPAAPDVAERDGQRLHDAAIVSRAIVPLITSCGRDDLF